MILDSHENRVFRINLSFESSEALFKMKLNFKISKGDYEQELQGYVLWFSLDQFLFSFIFFCTVIYDNDHKTKLIQGFS